MRPSRFSLSRSFAVVAFLTLAGGMESGASQTLVGGPASESQPVRPDDASNRSAAGVSEGWLSQVQEAIASSEYEISRQVLPVGRRSAGATGTSTEETGWQAPNRAQNFQIHFTSAGLHVAPLEAPGPSHGNGAAEAGSWEWGLALLRSGRPGALRAAASATLSPRANRGQRIRDGIVEWHLNEPRGLEHGFRLDAPPPGDDEPSHEVFVELALSGTLDPVFASDGQAIDFRGPRAVYVLHYGELEVTDATGRRLAARMEGFAEPGVRG